MKCILLADASFAKAAKVNRVSLLVNLWVLFCTCWGLGQSFFDLQCIYKQIGVVESCQTNRCNCTVCGWKEMPVKEARGV
jgi:hypothetical protein